MRNCSASTGYEKSTSLVDLTRLTAATPDSTLEQIFGQPVEAIAKRNPVASDEVNTDAVDRLGMLASALAGRTLRVAPTAAGELAWTDGSTVFVPAHKTTRDLIEALAVQASLLAAGSLRAHHVRRLTRRPTLARRYLAVEGHRALAANADLLPPLISSLVDADVAARSDSPDASMAVALSQEEIAAPPDNFGAIRARNLLGSAKSADARAANGQHIPRRPQQRALAELGEEDNDDGRDVVDIFSSPVGGGGALGKFFQKMLGMVRRLGEGGPPGADAPTHRTRTHTGGAGTAVVSTALAETIVDDAGQGRGVRYPEWDVHRRRYRPDWCTVQEVDPRPQAEASPGLSDGCGLRRPLARLGLGLDRYHRQAQGDDIDIDAAVEARVEVLAGSAPDEAVYLDSLRRRRDLAVLVLLDTSGSVAEPGASGVTVHEQQRTGAEALTVALHDLGDRVALYAFHSQGRSAVQLMPVKRFDDALDALMMRRLHALVPGAYSRLGAAIRHGAAVLERRGGTPRRLLVVVSDGLAYDHGYERVYGAADARRALAEARRRGTGCLCLTIGAGTNADDLQRVFGSAAHATIPRTEQLSQVIGPLFRAALRSAEVCRRVA
ncbi:MAG: VWA domain-containing protein [Mycolicibacterium sp.]|nr:VWA domain-containing protein [Mycolicibacterium sp.]